jgi:hypothetical protein
LARTVREIDSIQLGVGAWSLEPPIHMAKNNIVIGDTGHIHR